MHQKMSVTNTCMSTTSDPQKIVWLVSLNALCETVYKSLINVPSRCSSPWNRDRVVPRNGEASSKACHCSAVVGGRFVLHNVVSGIRICFVLERAAHDCTIRHVGIRLRWIKPDEATLTIVHCRVVWNGGSSVVQLGGILCAVAYHEAHWHGIIAQYVVCLYSTTSKLLLKTRSYVHFCLTKQKEIKSQTANNVRVHDDFVNVHNVNANKFCRWGMLCLAEKS